MRATSKIAPGPMSVRNTCDECAAVPVTRSVHDAVPRRDVTAKRGSPGPSSKPIAAVGAARRVDERRARKRRAAARRFLVARHDDDDVQVVQRAGGGERLERLQR